VVLSSIVACLRGNGDYGIKAFSILFEKELLFNILFLLFFLSYTIKIKI
jgi:hypothetical protein